MMYRTCTVQTNHDFSSEADMVKKLRVALALQPVGTALFANSPFTEGKPNGFVSFRSEIWRDTDNAARRHAAVGVRAGHGLRALRRLRARRADVFRQARRQIHRRRPASRSAIIWPASSLPGERATISDWANHVSTIFPEVRLKRYIEMRGSDGGPWRRLPSLPAFWVGLIYDDANLDACWDIVKDWTAQERQKLRDDVPRLGFKATIRGRSLLEIARQTLALAEQGLARRKKLDHGGQRRDDAICGRSRRSWRAASRRRKSCWRSITGRGTARSSRSYDEYAY